MDLSGEVLRILWPIALGVLSFLMGAIGYFLKDIRASLRDKQDRQDRDIEKLRDDLGRFKESLPTVYVMRDDFLRSMTAFDMKLDVLSRDLGELVKVVSEMVGGGKVEELRVQRNQRLDP